MSADTIVAAKKWGELSSATIAYNGSFPATEAFRTLDGSNLYAFGGPEWEGAQFICNPIPIKSVRIGANGKLSGATLVLNQTSGKPIHARQLIIGDFNGDGSQGMYFANHDYDKRPFLEEKN